MLNKITGNKIFLIVLLLIIPIMLSAAGNKEAEKGNDITLDKEVMIILEKVESGEITLDDAKSDFMSLEKEYQISNEENVQIQKMMDDVDSSVKKAEECKEQLQKQLQYRKKIQTKTQNKEQPKSSSSE